MRFQLALFAALVVVPVLEAAAQSRVTWAKNFQEAAEIAARDRKLVLLHFYSDACAPCQRVEALVYSRQEVADAISTGFVAVKINVEHDPETARRYQVNKWPTDVVVTTAGLEVYRTVSPQDPFKYIAMLGESTARAGTLVATREASSAAPTTNQQQPQQNPMSAAEGYSPRAGLETMNPHVNGGDYNPYGANPQQPNLQQHGSAPPSNADFRGVPNNTASPRDSSATLASGQVPAAQPRGAGQLPPVGMEGYCTITLAEHGRWQQGDKRFGAIHRGRLFLFAGPEEQKKFLADPDRYSPALSGYDAVRFMEKGELVDGTRRFGLTYNNQVYLFADQDSLRRFEANPKAFAETVYQAMLQTDQNSGRKFR